MSSATVQRTQSCPRMRVKRSYSIEQVRSAQRRDTVAPILSPAFADLSLDIESSAFTYAESSVMSDAIYPSSYPFFYTSLKATPSLQALSTVPDHLPQHIDLQALPMWTELSPMTPMKSGPLSTWNTTKRWLRTQKRHVSGVQQRRRPSFAVLPPVPPAPLTAPGKVLVEREPVFLSSRARPASTSNRPTRQYMLESPSASPRQSTLPSPSNFLSSPSLNSLAPKVVLEHTPPTITSYSLFSRALTKIAGYTVVREELHVQLASDLHLECVLDNITKSSLAYWQKQFFAAKTEVSRLMQQRLNTKHPVYDIEYLQCLCGLISPVSTLRDKELPSLCPHLNIPHESLQHGDFCVTCNARECVCRYLCECTYIPGRTEDPASPCFCPYCPLQQAMIPLPPLPRAMMDLLAPTNSDLLVLAGDVIPLTVSANKAVFHGLLEYACLYWRRVIFVPGNHEYYHTLPSALNLIKTKTQSNSQEQPRIKYTKSRPSIATTTTNIDSPPHINTLYSEQIAKIIKKISTSNTGGLSRSLSQSLSLGESICVTPSSSPYMATVEDTDSWLAQVSLLVDGLSCFLIHTGQTSSQLLHSNNSNLLTVIGSSDRWCFTGCPLWGDGRAANTMETVADHADCYCYGQFRISQIGKKNVNPNFVCECNGKEDDAEYYVDSDVDDAGAGSTIERSVRDYYACVVTSANATVDNNNEAYRAQRVFDTTKLHKRSAYKLHRDVRRLARLGTKVCVITHHAPLGHHTSSPEHQTSNIVGAFSGQLEWLLPYVHCWVAGHTHWSYALSLRNCLLLSNQRGYSGGECSYDPTMKVQFQPKLHVVHDSTKKKP